MTSTPQPQESMNEYLLARIAALESIVMLFWNEHPNRSAIRESAKQLFEAKVSNDLASPSGDIPIEIRQKAITSVFERVFVELLTGTDQTELSNLRDKAK